MSDSTDRFLRLADALVKGALIPNAPPLPEPGVIAAECFKDAAYRIGVMVISGAGLDNPHLQEQVRKALDYNMELQRITLETIDKSRTLVAKEGNSDA